MIMISNFLFNFSSSCMIIKFFVTEILTLGILFKALVAKLVILGISPSNLSILVLRAILIAKLVKLGILS